jgi:hypothetical protein
MSAAIKRGTALLLRDLRLGEPAISNDGLVFGGADNDDPDQTSVSNAREGGWRAISCGTPVAAWDEKGGLAIEGMV